MSLLTLLISITVLIPLNGQEYLQKKRATSARKSASALARYNRPLDLDIVPTP